MIFGLPRPTSGYIRYLQTSAIQTAIHRVHDLVVPKFAVLLGALGIAMSSYSSRQLTLHHRPSTRLLHWMTKPAINAEGSGSPSAKARLIPGDAAMASAKNDQPIKSVGDNEQPVKTSSGI